ncbi:hypothetical protein LEP1GSC062_0881 [Leptospira alexanderi serovar Manhao 3 str. L 60]|uniref:Uncharacterized protein n=1 Tax=Leptospira alexanderi serovar Manhao 3 str. L 60 TaxID=1049759 RepID=V6HTV6_9LEPT|nr:hypothetical protein LEP1GSC062_0881 [Leptospira alexanderi serovar Manhao 3 str. L 60]
MLFLGVNDPFELDRIEISSPSSSLARGTTVHLNAIALSYVSCVKPSRYFFYIRPY